MGWRDTFAKAYPPSWLKNYFGERMEYAIGIQIDALQEQLNQGVIARMPGYGTPEALPHIGRDRLMPRGPSESNFSYATRLQGSLDTWRVAGNTATLLRQLYVIVPGTWRAVSARRPGGTQPSVWHRTTDGQTVTKTVVTPGWNWDGHDDEWSRIWVILDAASAGITQWHIGDPGVLIGDGHTIGSSLSSDTVKNLQTVAQSWTAAHCKLVNIILDFGANFTETNPISYPGGNWDNPASRSNLAAYLDGAL